MKKSEKQHVEANEKKLDVYVNTLGGKLCIGHVTYEGGQEFSVSENDMELEAFKKPFENALRGGVIKKR